MPIVVIAIKAGILGRQRRTFLSGGWGAMVRRRWRQRQPLSHSCILLTLGPWLKSIVDSRSSNDIDIVLNEWHPLIKVSIRVRTMGHKRMARGHCPRELMAEELIYLRGERSKPGSRRTIRGHNYTKHITLIVHRPERLVGCSGITSQDL